MYNNRSHLPKPPPLGPNKLRRSRSECKARSRSSQKQEAESKHGYNHKTIKYNHCIEEEHFPSYTQHIHWPYDAQQKCNDKLAPQSVKQPPVKFHVDRGFLYPERTLPETLRRCPSPTHVLVEKCFRPEDRENHFGQPEERPLAEHYYKHGAAESVITMMQRRRRNPRLMSAGHRISNFNNPRCFAGVHNNFEILKPNEAQTLIQSRSRTFASPEPDDPTPDLSTSNASLLRKSLVRINIFPLGLRSVRFGQGKYFVYENQNEESSPQDESNKHRLLSPQRSTSTHSGFNTYKLSTKVPLPDNNMHKPEVTLN